MVYRAFDLKGKSKPCDKEIAMANFYAAKIAVKVTSMAIQIHGAYGLSPEYRIEKLFKTAKMLTVAGGTKQIQKLTIAGEALGLQAFV
jgi:alkylation response protein AidB-like acyl-CoA dehydrogenase